MPNLFKRVARYKPGEIDNLDKLVKNLIKKADTYINSQEEPLPQEEFAEMETTLFEELNGEYEESGSKIIKRKPKDKDDNFCVRQRKLNRSLKSREGKMYAKFAEDVGELISLAASSMTHAVEGWEEAKASIESSFPMSEDALVAAIESAKELINDQVENSYPGGASALDTFDDELPDGLPSLSALLGSVSSEEEGLKAANSGVVEQCMAAVEGVLETAKTGLETAVEDVKSQLPTSPAALDAAFDAHVDAITEAVEGSFPGGLAALGRLESAVGEEGQGWSVFLDEAERLEEELDAENTMMLDALKSEKQSEILEGLKAAVREMLSGYLEGADKSVVGVEGDDAAAFEALLESSVLAAVDGMGFSAE